MRIRHYLPYALLRRFRSQFLGAAQSPDDLGIPVFLSAAGVARSPGEAR